MSDFQQFMQQPFVGPVMGMLCFFGILLVVVIGLLVFLRRRKARQLPLDMPETAPASADNGELPDLDLLISDLPAEAAAPTAAVPAPAAAPARTARKGTFTVTINDGGTTEAVEVMTVLRDVVDGKLVVQMGDKILQNINTDADFKDRFTRLMRELAQVARPVNTPGDAPPPTQPPATAPQPPAAAAPPPSPAASEPLPEPPVAAPEPPPAAAPPVVPPPAPRPVPPPVSPGEIPGDLPRFSLDDQGPIKPPRGQKREVKPVPEINIAAAIEAYLQHKLRLTADYEGRSIHIYPSPDGGVSIEVDGEYYDSVGDVADPAVRGFLQTTIQEWQDRH